MTLGEKLAKLRKEKNYTQEQLAEILGVSRQSVSKWESDASYPETEKLLRLGEIYGCSMDYLLKNNGEAMSSIPAETCETRGRDGWRGGLLIPAVVCFLLILAVEILRATVTDLNAVSWIRLALLSVASVLFVLCLLRHSAIFAAWGSGAVLLLSLVELVAGFFTDQYVMAREVTKLYHIGEIEQSAEYTYHYFKAAYVIPYLLETVACVALFLFALYRVLPDGGRGLRKRMERLWFLPFATEVVAFLFGILMESFTNANECWLGGYRFSMEISIFECLLFVAFLLLLCRGLMGGKSERNG